MRYPALNIFAEIAIVFGICLFSEGIAKILPFTFPASVIALLILAALLLSRAIRPEHIQRLSGFLTANMAFFFLPPTVSIMRHADAILGQLVPFLLISFLTTPLVYCAAAWTVQLLIRLSQRKGAGSHD